MHLGVSVLCTMDVLKREVRHTCSFCKSLICNASQLFNIEMRFHALLWDNSQRRVEVRHEWTH